MLKIVLHEPQIPPNTGNIARTCAANRVELHLVGRLGFELSDRYLKRAGLDYWPYVRWHHHREWEAFARMRATCGGNLIGFSTNGRCKLYELRLPERRLVAIWQRAIWLARGHSGSLRCDGLHSVFRARRPQSQPLRECGPRPL